MEIEPFRWSWKTSDGDLLAGYAGIKGTISVTELIAHVRKTLPDISPDDIEVNFATIRVVRPATDEEIQERECWKKRQEERHEKWERETYERLREKYADTN